MVADNIAITDMVDKIAFNMGIDISNEKLSEFQDEVTRALLDIDVTLYYQLLELYEDVEKVRVMVTKYNLLLADEKEMVLTEAQKVVILGFILDFAKKIGNEDYLYKKIERDYEFEKGK